ncbi:MAG: aminopeptidase P family protein [Lachnospiraceae bacterium]|nr:aminopeptidase P family protein [Lachnospiraceae bacterium]
MKAQRFERIIASMKEQNIPQMIIADPYSIYYLTGTMIQPGERLLALYLNVNGNHKLVVNELFPQGANVDLPKVWYKDTDDGVALIADFVEKDKPMGIDKIWPAKFLLRLMELGGGSKFVNASPIVDYVRIVKDEEEQELMRKASLANDAVMEEIITYVGKGLTENELAAKLSEIYKAKGCDTVSFTPITAYGKGGADPHHETDDTKGKYGEGVVIDIGGLKDGYASDMTRTVFLGEVSERQREIYNIVLEANLRGIAAAKPGNRMCDVDNAARDYITEMGYGQYFTHRTGHSIGMECHEFGDVSAVNEDIIRPGQCFSVEPGIYLQEEGIGVRIEDLVLITEDGCEVLNKFTKELIVVPFEAE